MDPNDQIAQVQVHEFKRIAKNMQKYEKLSAEYQERDFNYMIAHYIKRIPEVCQRLHPILQQK